MSNQPDYAAVPRNPAGFAPGLNPRVIILLVLARVWRGLCQALPALLVVMLWFVFVYVLPLQALRSSRQAARAELTHLLQTDPPNTPAILEAFDRATEQVLFSAATPYFILGLATLFLTAQLTILKRRLHTAEHNIQYLREVVFGVDETSH